MAKEKKDAPKTVTLVAPSGTKVTVAESQAKKLRDARGYMTEAQAKKAVADGQ